MSNTLTFMGNKALGAEKSQCIHTLAFDVNWMMVYSLLKMPILGI
jgi:hypothetical protein